MCGALTLSSSSDAFRKGGHARLPALYKTVWEISQKTIIDLAADRGAFIDQSQSLNIHIAEPNYRKLTSMHFYGWKKGLKTGMYYLRTRPAVDAIKFTVDQASISRVSTSSRRPTEDGAGSNAPTPSGTPASTAAVAASTSTISLAELEKENAKLECSLKNREACEMCSS